MLLLLSPFALQDSDEDDGDYSDEGSSDASDAGDGDNPPALVTGSESDDDSDSDGPDNMEPVQPLPHTTTQSGFTPGMWAWSRGCRKELAAVQKVPRRFGLQITTVS